MVVLQRGLIVIADGQRVASADLQTSQKVPQSAVPELEPGSILVTAQVHCPNFWRQSCDASDSCPIRDPSYLLCHQLMNSIGQQEAVDQSWSTTQPPEAVGNSRQQ